MRDHRLPGEWNQGFLNEIHQIQFTFYFTISFGCQLSEKSCRSKEDSQISIRLWKAVTCSQNPLISIDLIQANTFPRFIILFNSILPVTKYNPCSVLMPYYQDTLLSCLLTSPVPVPACHSSRQQGQSFDQQDAGKGCCTQLKSTPQTPLPRETLITFWCKFCQISFSSAHTYNFKINDGNMWNLQNKNLGVIFTFWELSKTTLLIVQPQQREELAKFSF